MRDKVFNKKKFIESVTDHVKSMYRKTLKDASQQELYQAVSETVKDVIMDEWIATQEVMDKKDPKVVSFSGRALQVSKTSISLKKGKTAAIKATATPTAKITYSSSNKKIVTVNAKGVVKGKKKGKAIIYVKANGKTVQIKVQVK